MYDATAGERLRENNEQSPNKNIFSKFKNKRTANQQQEVYTITIRFF